MVNHLSHAKQWYLCRTRSLIGRPGAANRYTTADWLSAVDGQYKKTVATVICSIEDWRVFGLDSDYEEIYYITLEERGTSLCIS